VTPLRALELSALALATLTGHALARRAPHHRPVARALAVLLAIDVARLATHGATGALWCVDVGLVAGWYVAMAACVVGALARQEEAARYAGLGWWLSTVALLLASGHRGPALTDDWRAVFLVSLALQLCAAALYLVRARPARRWPGPPETVALLLAAGSLADLAGPWLRADVVRAWPSEQWQSAATWGIVAGWQAWTWRRVRG